MKHTNAHAHGTDSHRTQLNHVKLAIHFLHIAQLANHIITFNQTFAFAWRAICITINFLTIKYIANWISWTATMNQLRSITMNQLRTVRWINYNELRWINYEQYDESILKRAISSKLLFYETLVIRFNMSHFFKQTVIQSRFW